jgi:hypothetical protein
MTLWRLTNNVCASGISINCVKCAFNVKAAQSRTYKQIQVQLQIGQYGSFSTSVQIFNPLPNLRNMDPLQIFWKLSKTISFMKTITLSWKFWSKIQSSLCGVIVQLAYTVFYSSAEVLSPVYRTMYVHIPPVVVNLVELLTTILWHKEEIS